MELRHQLEEELKELMSRLSDIYIYGTGTVGKRLYSVLTKRGYEYKIAGFLTTYDTHLESLNGKPVLQYNGEREYTIFLGVGDEYQNEIIQILSQNPNVVYYNPYLYTFLDERYISEEWGKAVPTEALVRVDELMAMQFEDERFLRYDILHSILQGAETHTISNDMIVVNSKLRVCSEGNDVAEAVSGNKKHLKIKIRFDVKCDNYSREWALSEYGDTTVEKLDKLLQHYSALWRKPMIAILWPPARGYFDSIVEDMKDEVNVINQFEIELKENQVSDFILRIYGTDDSIEEQIQSKICRIECEKQYCFRIVYFSMLNPKFYLKRYGHLISENGMRLKKGIRDKYAERIESYLFDIIIHTADNYQQTDDIVDIIRDFV